MLEETILEHYAGGSITAKNTILIVLTIDFFTSCNFWHLVTDFIMVSISADLSFIQETCTKDK